MLKLKPFRETPGFCGPASLKIVLDYYGVSLSEKNLGKIAGTTKEKGTLKEGLIRAAKHFGFQAFSKDRSTLSDLRYFIKRKIPVIVNWFLEDEGHYSVVVDINRKNVVLMDPHLGGLRTMPIEKFLRIWFDFRGKYIKNLQEIVLRAMLVVTPKR